MCPHAVVVVMVDVVMAVAEVAKVRAMKLAEEAVISIVIMDAEQAVLEVAWEKSPEELVAMVATDVLLLVLEHVVVVPALVVEIAVATVLVHAKVHVLVVVQSVQ